MVFRVSGKNLDIGDALRTQIQSKATAALAKFTEGTYQGHVTVARDGTGFRTDCVVHLSSGVTLDASATAHDAYASCEQTLDRIETRLRKHKQWLKDRSALPGHQPDDQLSA